jgi:hypothetical protein
LTADWLDGLVERTARTPQGRALAVFDALDEWFRQPDFERSPYINALLETGKDDRSSQSDEPGTEQAAREVGAVRAILETYARQAGVDDPEQTSRQLYILFTGAIVSACRGDHQAARRARALAELLLESSA